MNAPPAALEIKATISVLIAVCGALINKVIGLAIVWITVVLLDYVTGSMKAMKMGKWSSAVARQGLWHKLGSFFSVLVAMTIEVTLSVIAGSPDEIITRGALTAIVLTWYIFTELGSIAENAAEMGATVPKFLTRIIEKVHEATEAKGKEISGTDDKKNE